MKKYILNTLLSLSLFCMTSMHAEEPPVDTTVEAPINETPPPPPPREVGRGASDGVDMAKQKNLGNIAIALLAITVATAAIILVSKNQGKHA